MKSLFKIAITILAIHILLGITLLIFDATIGINDQGPSFAFSMLYYYANYSAVWLLNSLDIKLSLILVIFAAIPQWLVLAAIISCISRLIPNKHSS